jgi:hypothetical protein
MLALVSVLTDSYRSGTRVLSFVGDRDAICESAKVVCVRPEFIGAMDEIGVGKFWWKAAGSDFLSKVTRLQLTNGGEVLVLASCKQLAEGIARLESERFVEVFPEGCPVRVLGGSGA